MKKKYFTEEERKQAKRLQDQKYRLKNKDKLSKSKKEYYLENKDKYKTKAAEKYLKNSEYYKLKAKEWKSSNKAKHNANCMLRYTKKLQATPQWLDTDDLWVIEQAYELAQLREQTTGVKWHVDHIIPLQHSEVCGLHVPWNLQVITASENCSKRNEFRRSTSS
jgi:actin-related protein